MGTGLHFIVIRTLGWADYLSHAIAFILVGGAGLIMSLTSMDIGEGLKDAVREDGAQTRAAIIELGKLMEERDKRIVNQLVAMDKRMEERDKRMEERMDRMITTVESISRDNKAFFKQMLEAQNRILEKVY